MILDASFLVALRQDDEDARELASEVEAANLPARVPTIVIWELYFGIGGGADVIENQSDYETLLANKPVVELDATIVWASFPVPRCTFVAGDCSVSPAIPTMLWIFLSHSLFREERGTELVRRDYFSPPE